MPGSTPPGPVGTTSNTGTPDTGTLPRIDSPRPLTVGVAVAVGAAAAAVVADITDPDIAALNLRGAAKQGAYALKKAHPSVRFTSGRRGKADQARAMASNVIHNRNWIKETYVSTKISRACQKWVDDHPDETSKEDIAAGLLTVMNDHSDDQLALLSKHLSGDAFDVQPVEADAAAIKKTIRGLKGLDRFLEKEGGLVRWHAQFD
jgi:hypothetical protein